MDKRAVSAAGLARSGAPLLVCWSGLGPSETLCYIVYSRPGVQGGGCAGGALLDVRDDGMERS